MNNKQIGILAAHKKGYVVLNGIVFYKDRPLKPSVNSQGYYCFGVRINPKKVVTIPVHRLTAYYKFGNKIFNKGIHVRHLDGNCLNNHIDNLAIGTASDNSLDRSAESRKKSAIYAASFTKKHNHMEILKAREEGLSYKDIMKKFNISSKGTLSFIINHSSDKIIDIV